MNNKIDIKEITELSAYAKKTRSSGIMVPAHELEYLLSEYDRLQSENQALKEALEFYANEENYSELITGWGPKILVLSDSGTQARRVLKG